MARGDLAKEAVSKKIAAAFGADYIGIHDKKIYVWANENGEKIQISLGMTCPKVPVSAAPTVAITKNGFNFEETVSEVVIAETAPTAEITEEEKNNIAELMKRLGL